MAERLKVVRNILAGRFGDRWSTAWAQAGFINHSTRVPRRIEEQLGLALSLATFFTDHSDYEVPFMGATAAAMTDLRSNALSIQNTVANRTVTLKDKLAADNTAYDALVKMMHDLIYFLQGTLSKSDSRWVKFGLNIPGTDTTPGQPQNVTASLTQTGEITVRCDAVPLATRYRYRMLRVGIDTEYTLAAGLPVPQADISDVLPGQTAQIIVQAVNGSLQGVASEPIQFTVPLPVSKTATPEIAAPVLPEVASVPTNGSRDGHAELINVRA